MFAVEKMNRAQTFDDMTGANYAQDEVDNTKLLDLRALDHRSRVGMKETDLSLVNKPNKRKPGGSLANAASQHLKNRPLSPVTVNGGFQDSGSNQGSMPGSRVNSFTSSSSVGSPLNPHFSSPRSSGWNPPRRANSPSIPQSPGPPQVPFKGSHYPSRPTSLEMAAMEEKIKLLETQLNSARNSQTTVKNVAPSTPPSDQRFLENIEILKQENVLLNNELNVRQKQLKLKSKELKEKNEVIKEMETYTNEQYDKLMQYETKMKSMDDEVHGASKELVLMNQELELLTKEKAVYASQIKNLKEQQQQQRSESESELSELLKFTLSMIKESNCSQLSLSAQLESVNSNSVLSALNERFENQLVSSLETMIQLAPSKHKKASAGGASSISSSISPEMENSPSIFSDSYNMQNSSITSISRSSSIYSKQLVDVLQKGADASEDTKVVKDVKAVEDDADQTPTMKSADDIVYLNDRLSNTDLVQESLKELKRTHDFKSAKYEDQIQKLQDQLHYSNYLLGRVSISQKHREFRDKLETRKDGMIELVEQIERRVGNNNSNGTAGKVELVEEFVEPPGLKLRHKRSFLNVEVVSDIENTEVASDVENVVQ